MDLVWETRWTINKMCDTKDFVSKNDFLLIYFAQKYTASDVLRNILFKKKEKKKKNMNNFYNTAHFLCTWHEYLQFKKPKDW